MAKGKAKIIVHGGEFVGEEFPLKPGENRIGRLEENDIILRDRSVSRRHATVHYEGDACSVEDLGSYNGIEIGGKKVQRLELEHGMTFRLGDFDLTFLAEADATGPQSALAGAMVVKDSQAPDVPGIPSNWQDLFNKGEAGAEEADAAVVGGAKGDVDLFGEKAHEEFQTEVHESESSMRRGLIIYITLLVFIVIAGFLVLNHQTKQKLWPDTLDYNLQRGQTRVLFSGEYADVDSSDEGVAVATPMRFLKDDLNERTSFVKVDAVGDGLAHVVVLPSGKTFRIIVKGKVPEDGYAIRFRGLRKEQRLHDGTHLLRSGATKMKNDQLAAALERFSRAEQILYPIRVDEPETFEEIKKRRKDCESLIEERVENLKREYNKSKRTDLSLAVLSLRRILELVPDPEDPQRQMVQIILDFRLRQRR